MASALDHLTVQLPNTTTAAAVGESLGHASFGSSLSKAPLTTSETSAPVAAPAWQQGAATQALHLPMPGSDETSFEQLLTFIRTNSPNKKAQGLNFEHLVRAILSSAQPWCERYSAVQSYAQWAQAHPQLADTTRDLGIDLVATNRDVLAPDGTAADGAALDGTVTDSAATDGAATESFTAIQCKFFAPGHAIAKSELDSFIAESNRPCFTARCLVHTGHLGPNALYALNHCQPAVQVIGPYELSGANVNWDRFIQTNQVELTYNELRVYQREAVAQVVAGFHEHDRGQMIMACGTGKTFTALKVAEAQVKPQGLVLYVAPSLALVSQSITEWKRHSVRPITAFAVCSDTQVGQSKGARNEELGISFLAPSELAYPVTTDAAQLSHTVAQPGPEQGLRVIFTTYQSLDVIYQAQHAYGLPTFDLIICDEAHRSAGAYLSAERNLGLAAAQAMDLSPQVPALTDTAESKRTEEETAPTEATPSAWMPSLGVPVGSKRAAARRTRAIYGNESTFTRIHNNDYISGRKRLYMSATPKVYSDQAKEQEAKHEAVLYSMDDPAVFGPVFYTLNFDRAVKMGCLVDFKVHILVGDKSMFPTDQQLLAFSQNNMAKTIGVWKAINHFGLPQDEAKAMPMKRVLVFNQVIDAGHDLNKAGSKQFTQNFQAVVDLYRDHITQLCQHNGGGRAWAELNYLESHPLHCECRHIDGSMNALLKDEVLAWFNHEPEEGCCHILSNVRCCSEGINIPALDGVALMKPCRSPLELVQIVGRVMRKAPGKKCGHIIIPIVTNDLNHPESVFVKNKDFETVWQVLNALKSLNPNHVLVDGSIDKIDPRIEIVCMQREVIKARAQPLPPEGAPQLPMELGPTLTAPLPVGPSAAVTSHEEAPSTEPPQDALCNAESAPDDPPLEVSCSEANFDGYEDAGSSASASAGAGYTGGLSAAQVGLITAVPYVADNRAQVPTHRSSSVIQQALALELGVHSHIVKRIGRRKEWEEWGEIVAQTCKEQVAALSALIAAPHNQELFAQFAQAFNASIKQHLEPAALVELLAQYIVLKPILNELMPGFNFVATNPIAHAMSEVLTLLDPQGAVCANSQLQEFYRSVEFRMANVTTFKERQTVMLELFERFFKKAFPKLQDKLGIVYTPIEVVDFINHSVEEILEQEFGSGLAQTDVHILDPFTGTGTFIARMMQCPELISPEALRAKYEHDLHAFEIVPLAYFIAALNIESTFHELSTHEFPAHEFPAQDAAQTYEPNHVVALTDTFVAESPAVPLDSEVAGLHTALSCLNENGARRSRINHLPLQVIVGNPPYSVGQSNQNDDNQNERYPLLEQRINETYAASIQKKSMKRSLYDSYIKAFRWASDHIGEQGIIAFVSNGAWLENQVTEGMRRYFEQEFSQVLVLDLKGNRRCFGAYGQRQGSNIFGDGSRTTIAITILVKNPKWQGPARILLGAVPDYLSTRGKLDQLRAWGSISHVPLTEIKPDQYGDWIDQRSDEFEAFLPMDAELNSKERQAVLAASLAGTGGRGPCGIFTNSSCGLLTSRDVWSYNADPQQLKANFTRCIAVVNAQIDAKQAQGSAFVRCNDPTQIKWDSDKVQALEIGQHYAPMDPSFIKRALYRPFVKSYLYYDPVWLERTYRMEQLFPEPECDNCMILVTDKTNKFGFSCFMTDLLCDYATLRTATHCFPRYLYVRTEGKVPAERGLMSLIEPSWQERYTRVDALAPDVVAYFAAPYGAQGQITADDVFYYIYGLLNSKDYSACYRHNLSKERPRIPRVARFEDFMAFAAAGRKLAQLHLHYEQVPLYTGCTLRYAPGVTPETMDYRVERLSYGKFKGKRGLAAFDKSVVRYNHDLTITDIPAAAHDYLVGDQSPLDWVVERYGVTTDSKSHIVNDANCYGRTQGNPRYILELILRVITVGIESSAIIKALPPLTIHPLDQHS